VRSSIPPVDTLPAARSEERSGRWAFRRNLGGNRRIPARRPVFGTDGDCFFRAQPGESRCYQQPLGRAPLRLRPRYPRWPPDLQRAAAKVARRGQDLEGVRLVEGAELHRRFVGLEASGEGRIVDLGRISPRASCATRRGYSLHRRRA
jgi:hypothetical protein